MVLIDKMLLMINILAISNSCPFSFQDDGLRALSEALEYHSASLTSLDISGNTTIGSHGLAPLSKQLRHFKTLTSLDLSGINLDEVGLREGHT